MAQWRSAIVAGAAAAVGFAAATLLWHPSVDRNSSVSETPVNDRTALEAALAPIAEQLRMLAVQPFTISSTRTIDPIESEPTSGAIESAIESAIKRLEALIAEFETAHRAPTQDSTLEQQLRNITRQKDVAAVSRAFDDLDREGRALATSYALLGPVAVAERFGAPDEVGGSDGKTWWYWRLDEQRSLGIAFANGLVCDMCMP